MIFVAGLAACTTAPRQSSGPPEFSDSPWTTDFFTTADPAVPVTVAILDPAPAHTRLSLAGLFGAGRSPAGASSRALSLGTTPWRHSISGRRPVGVVVSSGEMKAAPVPPYWAVVLRENGSWEMVPQAKLEREIADDPGTTGEPTAFHPAELLLAAGGFYPLIIDGAAVAGAFPGTTIRAPRVAIGGRAGTTGTTGRSGTASGPAGTTARIVVVATGPGDGGGLTTEELAQLLLSYDLDWALNLDGGRSAYLRFPDGHIRPKGIRFRRPGPVQLHFVPPDGVALPQEMVQ